MDEKISAWRKELHETFDEARRELREVISILDQLLAAHDHAGELPPRALEPIIPVTPVTSEREPVFVPPAPQTLDEAPRTTSDFSERLSQLKQQLNQRLSGGSVSANSAQPESAS